MQINLRIYRIDKFNLRVCLQRVKTVSGRAGESVGGMEAAVKPTMYMDVQVPPKAGGWKRPETYLRRLSEALPDTGWIPQHDSDYFVNNLQGSLT